jgi:hypothetical protein
MGSTQEETVKKIKKTMIPAGERQEKSTLHAHLDVVLAGAAKEMGVEDLMMRVAGAIAPYIKTERDCAAAVLALLAHSEAHDVQRLLEGVARQLAGALEGRDAERSLADLLVGPNAPN